MKNSHEEEKRAQIVTASKKCYRELLKKRLNQARLKVVIDEVLRLLQPGDFKQGNDPIIAVIPANKIFSNPHSLVVYFEEVVLVPFTTTECIEKILFHDHVIKYKLYQRTMQRFLKTKETKMPCATTNHILMTIEDVGGIWVNPRYISQMREVVEKAPKSENEPIQKDRLVELTIKTADGREDKITFVVSLNMKYLLNSYRKSCLCAAIILREYGSFPHYALTKGFSEYILFGYYHNFTKAMEIIKQNDWLHGKGEFTELYMDLRTVDCIKSLLEKFPKKMTALFGKIFLKQFKVAFMEKFNNKYISKWGDKWLNIIPEEKLKKKPSAK